jgi:hypothetical protein
MLSVPDGAVAALIAARRRSGTTSRPTLVCSITAMQTNGQTTRDELILVWLRSEWEGVVSPKPPDRQLIDNPDLADQAQNQAREELLYRHRGPILKELPDDFHPVWVNIEEADLADLYIVPSFDWHLDTGGTFRLVDTPANLAHGRELGLGHIRLAIDHLAKVNAIAPGLANYKATTTDEVLILIAVNESGPYTIIDGTHRAAALYRNYLAEPNLPWKGLLVADRAIADSLWYRESQKAEQSIAQFKQFAQLS